MLMALLCFSVAESVAAVSEITNVKGAGIWRSNKARFHLSQANADLLIENLRQITGLCELQFKESGQLHLGKVSETNSGSATARQILQRALDSGFVFFIEDHSESTSVQFGQMDEGTTYEDDLSNKRFLIWRVRLDFSDFRKMQAPREVRHSFNVGFTFLHELLHGLGHRDPNHILEIGECEEIVNQARAELHLPTRDQYFAAQIKITGHHYTVRLRFRDQTRQKNQYLFFLIPPGSFVSEITEGVVSVRKQPR
jgi:hypothetical protein